jgi:hypothetical protein
VVHFTNVDTYIGSRKSLISIHFLCNYLKNTRRISTFWNSPYIFSGSCIPTNESLFILLALPTLVYTDSSRWFTISSIVQQMVVNLQLSEWENNDVFSTLVKPSYTYSDRSFHIGSIYNHAVYTYRQTYLHATWCLCLESLIFIERCHSYPIVQLGYLPLGRLGAINRPRRTSTCRNLAKLFCTIFTSRSWWSRVSWLSTEASFRFDSNYLFNLWLRFWISSCAADFCQTVVLRVRK